MRTFENCLLLPAKGSTNSNGVRKGHAVGSLGEVTTASDAIFAYVASKQSKQSAEVLFAAGSTVADVLQTMHR